ncbi:MAG: copper-binding protein [Pseudomonadota bacterium]
MKNISTCVLGLVVALALPLHAHASHDHAAKPGAATPADAVAGQPKSEGEIKKIDKDTGKLTVKHGPLANLDMPAMTMVFKVKDPAMMTQVKTGDKIKFTVEKINGAFIITEMKPSM